MKKTIHIALVDDHSLFRNGIAALLSEYKDIRVVFEVGNGKEMKDALAIHLNVDVILLDINMPHMDGYASAKWLNENFPELRVLALSMFDDDDAIIKMLTAGAGGYVVKESSTADLYKAICGINDKGFYSSELVSGKLIHSLQQPNSGQHVKESITLKELEFLTHCASELTYKEIADKMNVASRTVDNYRESLFEKFDIKSRVGLVLFGLRSGLIEL